MHPSSSIHPSVHPSMTYPSNHLSIYLSTYLPVCLSVRPSIHPIPSHPSHPSLFLSVGLTKTEYPRHHTCLSRNGHGGKPQPMVAKSVAKAGNGGLSGYPFNGFQASKVVQDLEKPSTVSFRSQNFTNAKSRTCIFSFYTLQTQSPYGWSKLGIPINRCCFFTKHCTRICGSHKA
jgi:hypothetical protein